MSELHRLTVTKVDPDDGVTEFEHTHCPKSEVCAIYHECNVEGCSAPEDDDGYPTDDAYEGETRHGLFHRYLDGGWFSRDEPHNCAAWWVDEWDFPDDAAPGVYEFDLDYEDEGVWVPVGLTRIEGSS